MKRKEQAHIFHTVKKALIAHGKSVVFNLVFREEVYDGEADFSELLFCLAVALILLKEVEKTLSRVLCL